MSYQSINSVNSPFFIIAVCTLYKDDDGCAYFIYDRQTGDSWDGDDVDRCLYIVKLSDDYMSFTDEYVRIEEAYWREAAELLCIFIIYYFRSLKSHWSIQLTSGIIRTW